MSAESLAALAPMVPVAAAALAALLHRAPNLREAASLAAGAVLLACIGALVGPVLAGERPEFVLVEMLPGLDLAFRVEPFGLLFALIVAVLWLPSTLYSIGYLRANGEAKQSRFFACFALAIASAIGVAFAGNLLTLFMFYEALTLVTWPLVTHHGDEEARRGGRTYLALLIGTSTALFLPAIVATWVAAGTLDFTPGGILRGRVSYGMGTFLLLLFAFGIGKAALMPLHRWLPAAMVAPAPVSALLHAVAVVKAGAFCVVKVVVYVFGADGTVADFTPLVTVAAFTLVAASVVALRADNLKRRLAYSTVSQLAYVVLAVALLAPLSVAGAAMHVVAHAAGKITLFFAAGAVYTAAHKTKVSELDGAGRRMPWTFGAFAVASLSMIGLPPAVGVASKWLIVAGAAQAENALALAALFAGTLLSAGYLLPVVYRAFLRAPAAGDSPHGEAPATMVVALVATATLTVALFFRHDVPLSLARGLLEGMRP
ncbi:MAG: proton-conducting transporter membrane subunit [Betaproteobacteria bacterium]|nr:proton-conducting transporter membrane subunit [Betaproteobacteria bacterium]MDH5286744.1 proton-conducting transporter membrane subunit [Betaproteobacteria bacterium]